MIWTIPALLAPALWAVSNIIDANLLDGHIRRASTLVILTGCVAGIPGIVLALGHVPSLDGAGWVLGGIAGAVALGVYYPYFRALQEISALDALLLWNLGPVCVAVLARLFLGENLNAHQFAGAACLVASSATVLFRSRSRRISRAAVAWMVLASLLLGAEAVAEKSLYLRTSFGTGFACISLVQLAVAMLLWSNSPGARAELRVALRSKLATAVAGNEALDLAAAVARSAAVSLGPVTIVHAIGALQPVFLIGFSRLLWRSDRFRAETVNRAELWTTVASIGLAVIGMGLVESH